MQVGTVSLVFGAILGGVVPGAVANSVPERWVWPEKMAAGVLHRDLWSAGERLLAVADPDRWRQVQAAAATAARAPSPAAAASLVPTPRRVRPKRLPPVTAPPTDEPSSKAVDVP